MKKSNKSSIKNTFFENRPKPKNQNIFEKNKKASKINYFEKNVGLEKSRLIEKSIILTNSFHTVLFFKKRVRVEFEAEIFIIRKTRKSFKNYVFSKVRSDHFSDLSDFEFEEL